MSEGVQLPRSTAQDGSAALAGTVTHFPTSLRHPASSSPQAKFPRQKFTHSVSFDVAVISRHIDYDVVNDTVDWGKGTE